MRELDYVGIVSFTGAAAMILSGIVYVQLLPSDNPIVIGLLVAGFACLVSALDLDRCLVHLERLANFWPTANRSSSAYGKLLCR